METSIDYGFLSVIPPILTIVLAFLTRQVLLSLLIGTFVGATIMQGFNPIYGFMDTFQVYISDAMTNAGHAAIIAFTLILGGMVTLVAKMGGTQAIANKLAKKAKNARGAQLITTLLGCLVFFDDYANILVVGPTMRPLTDRLGVSREKLAYIVHTTAGIVAGIAVLTTWIGMEMGLVTDAFSAEGYNINAFAIIIKNIPYMFYNIFAIVISFVVAFLMRDFGPMYKAERRTRSTGKLFEDDAHISMGDEKEDQQNGKIYYAVFPILTMVCVIFFGIWYAGYQGLEDVIDPFSLEGFRTCFGNADPMPVTVWAAVLSSIVAAIIARFKIGMKMNEIYATWLKGATGLF
ncbi:MAG: Na+/H+ antiporter NhaC family protein, partial [Anaerovorax sp.]|nr:Na+/H+ antiporter NhaC family protein [Anaerovorax sp.]